MFGRKNLQDGKNNFFFQPWSSSSWVIHRLKKTSSYFYYFNRVNRLKFYGIVLKLIKMEKIEKMGSVSPRMSSISETLGGCSVFDELSEKQDEVVTKTSIFFQWASFSDTYTLK